MITPADCKRTVFVYWSRRGGLSWAALELAELLTKRPELNAQLCVSDHNELANEFSRFAPQVKFFKTFSGWLGAFAGLPRLLAQARHFAAEWKADNVCSVVVLMPHVWTPILGYFVRKAGIRYAVIVHDADPHIGDISAMLNSWIHSDVRRADLVYTLSQSVAGKLAAQWRVPANRIITLFHPLITYSGPQPARPHSPLRALFLGRILAYKGLQLLVGAVEKLRAEGTPVELGVVGEGKLGDLRQRLDTLGAELVNGWIEHARIAEIQSRYDLIVLPYIEASQSGVIMNAFGAGMPAIVTPVGGLAEQVEDHVTGLVAESPSTDAIANCIRELARDNTLYKKLASNIAERRHNFSVETFAERILAALEVKSQNNL